MTRILLLTFVVATSFMISGMAQPQKRRGITSEDFIERRPKSKRTRPVNPRRYHQASPPLEKPLDKHSPNTLKVGVTLWKVERVNSGPSAREFARRVEVDTQFHEGDLLRLSIESAHEGYLYVIDRDWFTDGSSGETNLIFPLHGEDNQLKPGTLIDIPAEHDTPLKASPKANQAGEMLTIIITSSPLSLRLSNKELPISNTQLAEWERMWSGSTERFEMNGGAGQSRTVVEQEAASRDGIRQLTRDDPTPQTIYFLTPRSGNGLFNLLLSYVR